MTKEVNVPQSVWAIAATVAPKPLYRPDGLTERIWARRQHKHIEKGTTLYLLPTLVNFFHRREEDYRTCILCPTSNNLRVRVKGRMYLSGPGMRVSGFVHSRKGNYFVNEHDIAFFWLSDLRVTKVENKLIKHAILERVWHSSYYSRPSPLSPADPVRLAWIYEWASSDEAKSKWEEILAAIQDIQSKEAGNTLL